MKTKIKKMFGYLRQDDSDHWYLIPEDKIKEFVEIRDKISYEDDWEKRDNLCDKFIESFEIYRLSGSIENLKIDFRLDEIN
jgi:hypothetical protein